MKKSTYTLLSIFSICGSLSADTGSNPVKESKPSNASNCKNQMCRAPAQMVLSHNFGTGVGHKGYSSADLFFIGAYKNFSPFADLRFHWMDDGRVAYNTGLGFRSLVWNEKLSVGGNVYYDYRNSYKLNTSQIAGGLEFLSSYLDFRINGYLPVSGKDHSGRLKFDDFSGNYINVKRKTEYAFPSANAEFGIPLPWISTKYFDAYIGIGPYYLFGDNISGNEYESTWGAKCRIETNITEYLSLEFEVNHDSVFETTYQGVVALNIPLYKKSACRGPCSTSARNGYLTRTLKPVIRNEIIPVKKKTVESHLKDEDGHVIRAFFVNNLAACPGIGTFESPFCNLANASAAPAGPVVVYVYEGNSPSLPYGGMYTMKDGQILQGSGTALKMSGVTIPPQTSRNPVLSNPGGVSVELANSNHATVQGLTIQNSNVGIHGTLPSNFMITHNIINNQVLTGIQIADHIGNNYIANNQVSNTLNSNGIEISASNHPAHIEIVDNLIVQSQLSGVLIRIDNDQAHGFVKYNTITRVGTGGFDIGTEVVKGSLDMIGNRLTSSNQVSIHALDGKQTFSNNIINNFQNNATAISYDITNIGASSAQCYIDNNYVNMAGLHAQPILVNTFTANGDIYAEITNNKTTAGTPTRGIAVQTSVSSGTICAFIVGNETDYITLQGINGPVNVRESLSEFINLNTMRNGYNLTPVVNFDSNCSKP